MTSLLCILGAVWCYASQCFIPEGGFNNARHVLELTQDPRLWVIAGIESRYDRNAVSSVGARGLFQIMPIAEQHVNEMHGLALDRTNMLDNIRLGMLYWEYLDDRYGGNTVLALVAYQWGLVHADRVAGSEEPMALPASTQRYINRFIELENKCLK